VPRLIRVIVIAGLAALVLITTCSPPQPRALIAPAAALQAGAEVRPLAPQVADQPQVGDQLRIEPTAAPASQPPPAPVSTIAPAPAPLVARSLPQPADPLGRAIDSYLNEIVGADWFQGSVLVARGGTVLLSKGYGLADAARGIPNTSQTRFRLASVTKQFTAMAILILQDRGRLDVRDSICAHLADCPETWRPITIHNLLTHTSGLPNYTDFSDYDATQMLPATSDELVARFRDQPLLFPPGTQYMYENSDYVLLGKIVEQASGQSYGDFLRTAIFEPLGMHDSGVDPGAGAEGQALGYRVPGELAPALDTSTLFAAGSLYSTVEDMYRWDQALYTTKLVPKPLLDAMWTPFLRDYGYGWWITTFNGHHEISHPGLIDGFATSIARYPDDQVTVIVLSNMSGADASSISNYIATLVLGSS
jgi:CubicO group peptidase (beta-lactamase class C family)